jgi:hypothetical protein
MGQDFKAEIPMASARERREIARQAGGEAGRRPNL